jgi:transposase InsO family protein
VLKKSRCDLGKQRGRLISGQGKKHALALIDEACRSGARQYKACKILGLSPRTVQRWRESESLKDKRKESCKSPRNKINDMERQRILSVINNPDFRDMTPHRIVAELADQGRYLASEATMYRILKETGQNKHRQASSPKKHQKPMELTATAPNQIWTWDITYLPGPTKGIFFYLYMVIDLYSRKVVAWQVHNREDSTLAGALIQEGCYQEGVSRGQIVLHSDNGSPMKGAIMLATLQKLGIIPSFSRPSVSNDNPFSESLFKTLKYRPWYPHRPFQSLSKAREWVEGFVRWYNFEHLHSKLEYVTPNDRHTGQDKAILEQRRAVYQRSKKAKPARWSGLTRQWTIPDEVTLNKHRTSKAEKNAA